MGLVGRREQTTYAVTDDDTALALGSGSLAVLGTPRLLAWCESATCAALAGALGPGETSVGVRVELDHLAASAVTARVEVTAEVLAVEGRFVDFGVTATEGERTVARGWVRRAVVDAERFLERLAR